MAVDTMTEAVVTSPVVADVLRKAGLLGDGPPPAPPPATAPMPKVGDIASIDATSVAKSIKTIPSDETEFILHAGNSFCVLKFPPNDASYLAELERLLTASLTGTKPVSVLASFEITELLEVDVAGRYAGKLGYLYVSGTI
jgi:hypothetical protein